MKAHPIGIRWHSAMPIFASEEYLRAVGDEYGWLGGTDDSGQLCYVLPYTIIKKSWIRMVRFRVETIPVACELGVNQEKTFLNSAVEYFRRSGADMIIPATTNSIFRAYPDGAAVAPYGTYLVDLRQAEDNLCSNVHPKNRTAIRNAKKKGVKILNGMDYIDVAFTQVRETFAKSGIPFMDTNSFKRLVAANEANVKIFVADYQGVVQGCAVNFFSNHSAYSVYAGGIANPVDGATKLLHWEAIKVFRDLGVNWYDFVGARINPAKGSKQEKLMLYKRQLGGRLVQGYMWKYSFKPINYALYCSAVRLFRGGDIVDQERHKLTSEGWSECS